MIVSASPYHLPSDLIVTLLTELAELENERLLKEGPDCFISRQKALKRRSFFVCGFLCVLVVVVLASQPPSSASLFGEDFVCAGRRSMNASAEVLPSPPVLWRNRNNFF